MADHGRRRLLAGTCALFAWPASTFTQDGRKPARVGWLGWTATTDGAPTLAALDAFRAGLAERGWHDRKNLLIEVRSGDQTQARALAEQLIKAKVDVIAAQGPMVFGARAVAGFLPLVFSINGDPVEANLVASLARPGANLTGISALSTELSVKRLQLMKEAAPGANRIAAVANQAHPGVETERKATLGAAELLGVRLSWFPLYTDSDLAGALDAIARERAQGIVAIPDNLINRHARAIAEFAAKQRVGTISGWAEFAEAGNLMSYGPNLQAFYRDMAAYVDKVLRGARPAELAIEQPTKFELVINLQAAKRIGVRVPQAILLRADRIIE